jgi:hypothetical protein
MTQNSMESSVLFSLAELQRLEQDRIGAEEHERATARQRRERERREAEAEHHRVEQARLASEQAVAAESAQRELETKARERARAQAAVEVTRIEAEAKVRLAAEEHARTQELALLRTRTQQGLYRACVTLSVALAGALVAMTIGAWRLISDRNQLKSDLSQAQQLQLSLAQQRDAASHELTRTRQDWATRLKAANASLATCEAHAQGEPRRVPPSGLVDRVPPPEHTPPPPKCKFEGDPMCDTSNQPH